MNNIKNLSIISLEEINKNDRNVFADDEKIYNSLTEKQKVDYQKAIIRETFTGLADILNL